MISDLNAVLGGLTPFVVIISSLALIVKRQWFADEVDRRQRLAGWDGPDYRRFYRAAAVFLASCILVGTVGVIVRAALR